MDSGRSEGERKTKKYLEKDSRERAKQSGVEELGGSQSGYTRQKVFVRQRGGLMHYCWFSHDVTKIQTKKLSILLRFYFHDELGQLKTNLHTNFRFKRVLGFVIDYA